MTNPRVTVNQYRERASKVTTSEEARSVVEGIRLLLEREFNEDLQQIGFSLANRYKIEDLKAEFSKWRSRSIPRKGKKARLDYNASIEAIEGLDSTEELHRLSEIWGDQAVLHPKSIKVAIILGVVLVRLGKKDKAREEFSRALTLSWMPDLARANRRGLDKLRLDIQSRLSALNTESASPTGPYTGAKPLLLYPRSIETALADAVISGQGELDDSAAGVRRRQSRLLFPARFMNRPEIEGMIVEASQLAGPVATTLGAFDANVSVPVEFAQRQRQIGWRSVHQLSQLPPTLRCPVVLGDSGDASLFVGAWLIPLSVFGPGTALSAEHRAILLHPQSEAARWEECRLEPLANDKGWIDGWFSAIDDPQNPRRRRYAVRTLHGAWLRWAFMNFAGKRFVPPEIGSKVRCKPRLSKSSSSIEAVELEIEGAMEAPPIVRCTIRRFTGGSPSLLVGALALPAFPDLQIRDEDTTVDIGIKFDGSGNWILYRPGQGEDRSRSDLTLSPVAAALQGCIGELRTDPNGISRAFEIALSELQGVLGRRQQSRATEVHLANEVSRFVRSCGSGGRSLGLSKVIAALLGVPARKGQGEKRDPWHARWNLAMTHLLAGEAGIDSKDGRLYVRDDPVSNLFALHPDFPLYNAFLSDYGPALCRSLVDLGNLGYRLADLHLYTGCSSVDLALPSADGSLPVALRLVAQYGQSDVSHAIVRELLRAAPTGSARALVFCVQDPQSPGVGRLITASKAVAILESAAHDCPSAISDPNWAKTLAENALSYLQLIPNPTSAFAEEARSLSPTQFIPRPALLAELQNALEARQEALGIFSMRKAGKTATATLLSTTFRFEHHYVNLGEEVGSTTDDELGTLVRRIDEKLSGEQRKPLLILDEFDTYCRHLGDKSRSIALRFLKWLEDRARRHPVLCIGLDPTVLTSLYPESNPLQTLHLFQLPYFNLDESRDFARALGRQLVIPDATITRAFTLSGGHPVVMLNLFHFSLCAGLGFPASTQFVPRSTSLDFTNELWDALQTEFGAPVQDPSLSRYRALKRVLETRRSQYASIHDPWLVMQKLAELEDYTYSMQSVAALTRDVLRTVALDPSRPAAEIVNQLLHWGLLRKVGGAGLEWGIPLLRVELTGGKWKCHRPN